MALMLAAASSKAAAACCLRVRPLPCLFDGSLSTMSTTTQQEELYLATVTERFHQAPESAARSLADSLSNQQRAILLKALGNKAADAPRDYLDKLFQEVDTSAPLQQLDKYAYVSVYSWAGVCLFWPCVSYAVLLNFQGGVCKGAEA